MDVYDYWTIFIRDYRLGKVAVEEIRHHIEMMSDWRQQYHYFGIKKFDIRFNASKNRVVELLEAAIVGIENEDRRRVIANDLWNHIYNINERSKKVNLTHTT